ncbi:MAG: transport permease protein [Acidimicrobiales bacterium]|nr:MAG: transport permease protein [Acidimicrobiales bacterium]
MRSSTEVLRVPVWRPDLGGVSRVVEREFRVWRRLWRASVFSSFLSPLLFIGVVGLGLGSLMPEAERLSLPHGSYFVFVAGGLVAAYAMETAGTASLYMVMDGMTWSRTYHVMVTAPLSASDVYAGVVAWIVLRAGLSASVFLAVAWALGGVPSPTGPLAVPAAMLTAGAYAAPLAAWAATRTDDSSFGVILRLIIQPSFLFSGTLFPTDRLPDLLRWVVYASPIWHGVELTRAATTGEAEPAALVLHTVVLTASCVAAGRLGLVVFHRRLAA